MKRPWLHPHHGPQCRPRGPPPGPAPVSAGSAPVLTGPAPILAGPAPGRRVFYVTSCSSTLRLRTSSCSHHSHHHLSVDADARPPGACFFVGDQDVNGTGKRTPPRGCLSRADSPTGLLDPPTLRRLEDFFLPRSPEKSRDTTRRVLFWFPDCRRVFNAVTSEGVVRLT